MENIWKAVDNMKYNADLYTRIAKTKERQEDYKESELAKALQNAWESAAKMIEDVIKTEP